MGTRRYPGPVGVGTLWLLPILGWWVIRWSANYRLDEGPLLAVWGLLFIPPVVATCLWIRNRVKRHSDKPSNDVVLTQR